MQPLVGSVDSALDQGAGFHTHPLILEEVQVASKGKNLTKPNPSTAATRRSTKDPGDLQPVKKRNGREYAILGARLHAQHP